MRISRETDWGVALCLAWVEQRIARNARMSTGPILVFAQSIQPATASFVATMPLSGARLCACARSVAGCFGFVLRPGAIDANITGTGEEFRLVAKLADSCDIALCAATLHAVGFVGDDVHGIVGQQDTAPGVEHDALALTARSADEFTDRTMDSREIRLSAGDARFARLLIELLTHASQVNQKDLPGCGNAVLAGMAQQIAVQFQIDFATARARIGIILGGDQ